jgi:hypothetical protein
MPNTNGQGPKRAILYAPALAYFCWAHRRRGSTKLRIIR